MSQHRTSKQATRRALRLRKDLTEAELALWQRLRRSQLGVRFRRQEPIGPYIVDFVCFQRRLVVEADGSQHDWSDHDRRRESFLRSRGFRVLRFENRDIAWHFDWVIDEIKAALREDPPTPALRAAVPSPQKGD
jgi:very-short-patch-repair endonuclease